ncbi:Kunitz/Bovine pancreatic trypsin inhibitor domain protein [Teladorsagia circumcincta]|uniref:Kunitz/Bovine pancreatic trypsin inhibitor domain protein n=1 Tax=Teladorsagia circumcincta TaxID=45464 RepID=A0A2G9U551_TELCI|nr:Kunitz/Bovine pancreatic trypsin inhibitor domain protein [Teladorsagia circumcincta]
MPRVEGNRVYLNSTGYLLCENGALKLFRCPHDANFEPTKRKCITVSPFKRRRRAAGAQLCGPYGGRQYLIRPEVNYDRGVAISVSKSTTPYYYDVERGQCGSFTYHGLGNFNNFVTKQACEAFCSRCR